MSFLDSNIVVALEVVAGVFALYFFGAPFLVKAQFRKPVESGFRMVDADREPLSDEVAHFFESAQPALEALGFQLECHLKFDMAADLMDAYAIVMSNNANRDLAMALVCVAPVRLQHIEFSTELDNGKEINTNNGPQLPLDAVLKAEKSVFWLPGIQDTAELYHAHSALCSANATAAKKSLPHGTAIVDNIRRGMREDYDHALHKGIFHVDQIEEVYRLSLSGAFQLTWPNMFPLNAFAKARRKNRDRNALAKAAGR